MGHDLGPPYICCMFLGILISMQYKLIIWRWGSIISHSQELGLLRSWQKLQGPQQRSWVSQTFIHVSQAAPSVLHNWLKLQLLRSHVHPADNILGECRTVLWDASELVGDNDLSWSMGLYLEVICHIHNYSLGLRTLNKLTLSSLGPKMSENKIVSSWRLCLQLVLNSRGKECCGDWAGNA